MIYMITTRELLDPVNPVVSIMSILSNAVASRSCAAFGLCALPFDRMIRINKQDGQDDDARVVPS
jgi:hypothetical protein